MRVARILGPMPLLADVCLLYRLAGRAHISVKFTFVGPGLLHCEEADVRESRSGRDVYAEMLGLIEMCEDVRIGSVVDDSRQNIGLSVAGLEDKLPDSLLESPRVSVKTSLGPMAKVRCTRCGFDVNPVGHGDRCRKVRQRDAAAELLGDSLHSMDVKVLVVSMFPKGTHYTEIVKEYVVSSSQRDYLLGIRPDLKSCSYSDHTYANIFETMYCGEFRDKYLCWLRRDLELHGGEDVYSRSVEVLRFLRGPPRLRRVVSWRECWICYFIGFVLGVFICANFR